jgi:hypothetical protein
VSPGSSTDCKRQHQEANLGKLVHDPGYHENVAVLNGADVDQHQVGVRPKSGAVLKPCGLGRLVDLEQDLFLGDLGEIKALRVVGLADL